MFYRFALYPLAGVTQMPVLQTPAGHPAPNLGAKLGQGSEGAVYENLDESGWVVKVFDRGSNPLAARNQLDNLARARAIPGRSENVVKAHPLLDPANPRNQNWLIEEEVLPTNVPQDMAQKAKVLGDFLPQIPDVAGNLMWGTTAGNSTPRWILVE